MKVWLVTAYTSDNESEIKAVCKTKEIAIIIRDDCYKLDEEDQFAYYDGYEISEEEVIE